MAVASELRRFDDFRGQAPVETERGPRIDLGEMRRQGRLETRYQPRGDDILGDVSATNPGLTIT